MLSKRSLLLAGAAVLALVTAGAPGGAAAATVVHVAYTYADPWTRIQTGLADAFQKLHPDIRIEFAVPYTDYEDATQKLLRGAMTGDLPDLAWMGLNRVRVFADKKAAVDLTPFIAKEADWQAKGYSPAMMDLGSVGGKVYGIATGASLPILYYNTDLVRKAGGDADKLPRTWDEVIALGGRIKAQGGTAGLYFGWDQTGNWLFQNLVRSDGGAMMSADEHKVAFDGPAGQWAVETITRMARDGGMPTVDDDSAIQAFLAGKLGIYVGSIADLTSIQANIGDRFALRTAAFPVPAEDGKLVAGGAAGMMFTKDPAVQSAAWEYLKFAGSAEGSAIVVHNSGYLPPNALAATITLGDFYERHPNQAVALPQAPIMSGWYAFPGANGLKIFDVIKGGLQQVVAGTTDPKPALAEMSKSVQNLLPR